MKRELACDLEGIRPSRSKSAYHCLLPEVPSSRSRIPPDNHPASKRHPIPERSCNLSHDTLQEWDEQGIDLETQHRALAAAYFLSSTMILPIRASFDALLYDEFEESDLTSKGHVRFLPEGPICHLSILQTDLHGVHSTQPRYALLLSNLKDVSPGASERTIHRFFGENPA